MLELHRDDPWPVTQILEHTTTPIGTYPIFDLPTVPAWSRHCVVLMGDAVHATDPSAGQGASLALEDAAVLARALASHPHPAEAFKAYEQSRRERVERVVAYAASVGDQKKVSTNAVSRAIRDTVLPVFLRKAAKEDRHNWIYDYTAPWP